MILPLVVLVYFRNRTKDTEVGQSVDILTDGYLTARRNNVMQPSGYIRDQGPMLALEMGNPFGFGYQTVNGSGYSSNYLIHMLFCLMAQ